MWRALARWVGLLVVVAWAVGCSESHTSKGPPSTGGSGGGVSDSGGAGTSAGSGGQSAASGEPDAAAGGHAATGGGGANPSDAGGTPPPSGGGGGGRDAALPVGCDPDGGYHITFTLDGAPLTFDDRCDGPSSLPRGEFHRNSELDNAVRMGNDSRAPSVTIDDSDGIHGAYDVEDPAASGHVGDSTGRMRYVNIDMGGVRQESLRLRYTKFEPVGGVIEGSFDSGVNGVDSGADIAVMRGEFRICRTNPGG